MNSIKRLCAMALSLSALMVIGCGDDSSDTNNSGNADAKAYLASCEKLCVAQDTAKCDTGGFVITLDDCKGVCQIATAMTGDCATKYKLYGECTDKQTDVCAADTACATEMQTASTACVPK